jgi:hypothetical protein
MTVYIVSDIRRIFRKTLTFAITPSPVIIGLTRYVVGMDSTVHHVRLDPICDCDGPPASLSRHPHVQDYLAVTLDNRPPSCPICDRAAVADQYLDSSHAPAEMQPRWS